MNNKSESRNHTSDYFKKGIDHAGNRAMRESEKDILGEPLPELSFDIEKVFQRCKKITDHKNRLIELEKYERDLSNHLEILRKRYDHWVNYQHNPLNIDFEELHQIIAKGEYALEAFRQEISSCQIAATHSQEVPQYSPAYKVSDLDEYVKDIPSQDSDNSMEEKASNTSIEGETTSIRLNNPLTLDTATQLVKALANQESLTDPKLLDLEGKSFEVFAQEHFHEDGESGKGCSRIKWEGTLESLAFLVLLLVDYSFVYFPQKRNNNDWVKSFILNKFQARDRAGKMTTINPASLNKRLSDARTSHESFDELAEPNPKSQTQIIEHFIYDAIQKISRTLK